MDMLPDLVKFRKEIIYITGLLEILGAMGLLIPTISRIAGICLVIMFICFIPANIYAAIKHVGFGGHEYGPIYLLFRVPLQLFFIWWTYRYVIKEVQERKFK